jgi:hypothetical protein
MSHREHTCIVVTTYDRELVVKVRDEAIHLGLLVSGIARSRYNALRSFAVFPSGATDGRPEEETYEESLRRFIQHLHRQACDDEEATPLEWFAMKYGADRRGIGEEPVVVRDHGWSRWGNDSDV